MQLLTSAAIWFDILDADILHRQAQTKIIENVQVLLAFGGYDPEPKQHGDVSGRLILAAYPGSGIYDEKQDAPTNIEFDVGILKNLPRWLQAK